ncbi:MAG: imelysin family protein [Tenacibaculum sp.]
MNYKQIKNTLYILAIALIAIACKSDNNDNSTDDNFDRSSILINVADNIIIPAFKDFSTKAAALKAKVDSFNNLPEVSTLTETRAAWLNAYKAWQHVGMFQVGKAEEVGFINFTNVYPVESDKIKNNIDSGSYDLDHPNNHNAQGFSALDYMLYGLALTDDKILDKYTKDAKSENYKTYLNKLATKISELSSQILNDWENTYRDTFVSESGNTSTSSLNLLTNDFIFFYEKELRSKKIGIPAGKFSGDIPYPDQVEAFYSQTNSRELAIEALNSVISFFNGTHFNDNSSSGASLKSYLEALDQAKLAQQINEQLQVAKAQINTLNNNFYQQINSDNASVLSAYDELQKVVTLIKVRMMQAIQISVDFNDSDGD